jgi:hypothetical protein
MFPALDVPDGDPRLCASCTPGCLALVRKNPDQANAALEKFAELEANLDSLARHDHAANGFPPSLQAPMPEIGNLAEIGLTRAALVAVTEGPEPGLARACAYATTWRRLRAETDMLLFDMVAIAQVAGAAQLVGDIVASSSISVPWSRECRAAFAPLAEREVVRCPEFAWEFRMLDEIQSDPAMTVRGVKSINWTHLRATLAPAYAHMCRPTKPGSVRVLEPLPPVSCSAADKALNPYGCILVDYGNITPLEYRNRAIDLDGRLATLRTALWLREQSGDPAIAFANRPADLRTPEHDVAIDVEAGTLTMTALETNPLRASWTVSFARP